MGGPGSGGHNRKPTTVKARRGTLKASRENPREPLLPGSPVPAAPADWSARERAVWARVATCVASVGCYTAADEQALESWVRCELVARALTGRAKKGGQPFREWLRATQEVRAHAAHFGCTPASRARVSRAPVKGGSGAGGLGAPPVNPLDEFRREGGLGGLH